MKQESQAQIPVNWDIHYEQIVVDKDANDSDGYVGYELTFSASNWEKQFLL